MNEPELAVLVTGAASGLGRACAERFLTEGYRVIGWDVVIGGDDRVDWQQMDVTNVHTIEAASATLPPLHAIVTCAGVSCRTAVADTDPLEWERVLRVNLSGTFLTARYGLPALRAGHGTLVTIGSVAGSVAFQNRSAYCASKAAVRMLTQCLAIEWAPYGVRAITISPGFTAVGMSAEGIASGGNSSSAIIDHTPQARLIAAEEIADLVYLGASERMRSVTGSELLADGGFVAGSGL